MSASEDLIRDAGLGEALGFLSNQRSTLTRVTGDERVGFAVTGHFRTLQSDEDRQRWNEDPRWGNAWATTLITPEQNAVVAAELDKLWAFCVARIHDHPVLTVPAGSYFFLGDNRDNSADSRYFGVVPRHLLVGGAHHVLVSADIKGQWLPRLERFGEPIR